MYCQPLIASVGARLFTRWLWLPVVAVFAAHTALLVHFSPLLLEDYPNHLARAFVMADLIYQHGRDFGAHFDFHFLPAPYILGDLVLTMLVHLLGITAAAVLWPIIVFLSLPFAMWTYLRAKHAPRHVLLVMLILSAWLSIDTFFLMGFMSFRLAVAMVLFALACAEPLMHHWSWPRYAIFVSVLMLGYLVHLTAPIFTGIALVTIAIVRVHSSQVSLSRATLLLAPVGLLGAWQILVAARYRQPTDLVAEAYSWGLATKAHRLIWDLLRYNGYRELAVLGAIAGLVLVWMTRRASLAHAASRDPELLEPFGLALVFFAAFLVMPSTYPEAAFIDVRALPFVEVFLLLGLCTYYQPRLNVPSHAVIARTLAAVICAVLVSVLNAASLAKHLSPDSQWLSQYRALLGRMPPQSKLLPIYTGTKAGAAIRSSLHAASFALIDRGALIPYLFSGDTGAPMKYFRYKDRPYAPDEAWYIRHEAAHVDWRQIASQYQYLLVMKPFDPTLIPIAAPIVAENSSGVLAVVASEPRAVVDSHGPSPASCLVRR